ncbi:MAG: peptidylprolyl isomerase [Saprospiraceae bacterium]|nr:peptidylprolyl isomerase [Saprospiraceae bacterium]MBK7787122.1 peptidylprolyl isomerase [Saprospiraceae bacterium]MBK9687262.1 peptidylprolyl isomerase [Saprospiraceae bacterium]
MALIGKIRKNFWIVLILLAMALASFILMDVMGSRKGGGSVFNQTIVGKVAGQKIDYLEFEKTERALYSGSDDVYGRRQMLWNYLLEKALVEKQVEELGLGVSRDELMELQFGNNLSSVIQNNFRDPNTGQVNRQQLLQFKQALETGQELAPEFRNFWAEQEKQIVKTALQDKINNLVIKSMIVPKWQAEVVNQLNNDKLTIEFVRVTYDKIPNDQVKLTDEDYKNFMSKSPAKYSTTEETRLIDYATFSVLPTSVDSAAVRNNLASLKAEFKSTTNDSLFAATNGGGLSPTYGKVDDLTGMLKDSLPSMSVGSVMGPFVEGTNYVLAKLVDRRVLPDSVKARHILRRANPGDAAGLAKAQKTIDSLKILLTSGAARFDSLATKNSEDTGSAIKGGDLGTFAQGAMVKPFNDVCFINGTKGNYYSVTTQFGVHLIEIQDQKYVDKSPKYKIALIPGAIVPSQETQDAIYDKVTAILSKIKNTEDFKKAAESNPEIKIQTSRALKTNDYTIPGFPGGETSRSIIKWAFDNDANEVSPVMYSFQDEVNFYTKNFVIAGVKAVNKPGLMSIEEAKASLEFQVKNAKKAEMLAAKIKTTDLFQLAAEYGTTVDTASVSFAGAFMESIQTAEPKVVGKAFGMEQGKTSGPIEGTTGVFVVKVVEKVPSVLENSNLAMIKSSIANSGRSGAGYRLWEAIKKKYAPEDYRSKFF